jgi:hypothetical protein
VTANSVSARTLCLLNQNAQCNPIWLSRSDGLKLVHFPTTEPEAEPQEPVTADAAHEACERHCVLSTHLG